MKGRFLSPGLLVLALIAWFAAPTHGQIYESICRDANCTDIALGPLALIPQCYRTPQGSVRLNINESDPDILDLCFYLSEDCNETSVDTCHVFVNGEPSDCPFFRGISNSLYVVFEWDPATIELLIDIIDMFPHFHRSRRQLFNNFFGLTEFGNWCGPGHGGTNDCCDDEVCSACNDTIGLTMDCLDQCPAEDDLDFACAAHDFCYGANDYEELFPDEDFECSSLFGIQKSGYCECDCQLVETARDIDDSNDFYKSALIFTFTHITNCWYNSTSGPVCNTKGDDRILVTEFC